jgi:heme exporter protein A
MNNLVVDALSFERDDILLFEHVNADWRSGDIVQLAGQNGSGKTTLMRTITGFLQPLAGEVRWNGSAVSSYEFKSSLLYLGHQVGVKATMTPLENLAWYFALNGVKAKAFKAIGQKELLEALDRVGLASFAEVPCYQLSAGQQRRVALARLMLSEAPLWVLDEPFTAIDKAGVVELESCIEKHAEAGGIVILTTHQAWQSGQVKLLDMARFKPQKEYLHD